MEEQEEILITPEPPGHQPLREALPGSLPANERRQASPADRRFILLLGVFTIGSIALMMLVAFILLLVVK